LGKGREGVQASNPHSIHILSTSDSHSQCPEGLGLGDSKDEKRPMNRAALPSTVPSVQAERVRKVVAGYRSLG
jgi:hypothetical protein